MSRSGSEYFAPIQLDAWRAAEGAEIVAVASTATRIGWRSWGGRHGVAVRALVEEREPEAPYVRIPR